MLLGEWLRFIEARWKWLISWIGLRHFISLIFKLLLEGKDLGCSSKIWRGFGDYCFTHTSTLKVVGKYNKNIICSLKLCWIVNHRFFYFSIWISTCYITNVWYVEFWVKRAVEYWWENIKYSKIGVCFKMNYETLITIFYY
jgi:hypothetical protein